MKYLCFLFVLPFGLSAQTIKFDFPSITKEDLLESVYKKDSTAKAVFLFDQGETIFDGYNGSTMKRYTRIKLYKKDAFGYGNVTIYNSVGNINQIKAITHHYDHVQNRIVSTEMAGSAILKTRFNKWTDKITFTLPNLSEGAIIEYAYTNKMDRGYIPSWNFQYPVPVEYSEYLLSAVTARYESYLMGMVYPPKYTPKYKGVYARWVMQDIPALKQEPFMPHERIYRASIHFYPPRDGWNDEISELYDSQDFWQVIQGHPYLKKTAEEIARGLTTEQDKIKAICYYVKNQIEWNGNFDFLADHPKDVLERKKGTSGDINLLLGSLLKKAGFDVAMVLISTRGNGFVDRQYPSASQFNNVICMVQGSTDTLLVDGTDKMLPYNVLPSACLNYDGLMLSSTQNGWITFGPNAKRKYTAQANVELTDEGDLKGKLSILKEGYAAHSARRAFSKVTKEEYIKDFSTEHQVEVVASSVQADEMDKPFTENYDIMISGKATVNGDHIYLNPFIFFQMESNPFMAESRTYPIDFGLAEERVFVGTIKIPQGYVVDEMPASKIFNLPGNAARYIVDCQQRQGQIVVTTKLQRNKLIFKPNEYVDLREFYARVVAKNLEQVVLKKAN
jgi:hypothetical protein